MNVMRVLWKPFCLTTAVWLNVQMVILATNPPKLVIYAQEFANFVQIQQIIVHYVSLPII
jgi:hypothetical protein